MLMVEVTYNAMEERKGAPSRRKELRNTRGRQDQQIFKPQGW